MTVRDGDVLPFLSVALQGIPETRLNQVKTSRSNANFINLDVSMMSKVLVFVTDGVYKVNEQETKKGIYNVFSAKIQ